VGKYSVEVKPPAQKELEALSDELLTRVVRKPDSSGDAPRPAGCKKLKGYEDQWRIRAGDWRVVYVIDDAAKLVSVTRIAHRREVRTMTTGPVKFGWADCKARVTASRRYA
jgi:mRNA interferase RelE/StbE